MRLLLTLATLIALVYGGWWWLDENRPELKEKVVEWVNKRQFRTLGIRFTTKQIAEKEPGITSLAHSETEVKFYPHLLMDIKFTNAEDETEEGVLLWDLRDGEMVLDTKNWRKTHGFSDCIHAGATRHEYRLLYVLTANGGRASRRVLQDALHISWDALKTQIDRCIKKQLVVQKGDEYRIHLNNPRFYDKPSTRLDSPLIMENRKGGDCIARRYSPAQVKKAAEEAFGADFIIRSQQETFLPVYRFILPVAGGSFRVVHWNAFNGREIEYPLSFE